MSVLVPVNMDFVLHLNLLLCMVRRGVVYKTCTIYIGGGFLTVEFAKRLCGFIFIKQS